MSPSILLLILRFMEHALVERCQYGNWAMAKALLVDVQAAVTLLGQETLTQETLTAKVAA